MQVLEHGNSYKQIRCKYCNALLEYTGKDIKHNSDISEDFTFSAEWDYIICPECLNKIILSERVIEI